MAAQSQASSSSSAAAALPARTTHHACSYPPCIFESSEEKQLYRRLKAIYERYSASWDQDSRDAWPSIVERASLKAWRVKSVVSHKLARNLTDESLTWAHVVVLRVIFRNMLFRSQKIFKMIRRKFPSANLNTFSYREEYRLENAAKMHAEQSPERDGQGLYDVPRADGAAAVNGKQGEQTRPRAKRQKISEAQALEDVGEDIERPAESSSIANRRRSTRPSKATVKKQEMEEATTERARRTTTKSQKGIGKKDSPGSPDDSLPAGQSEPASSTVIAKMISASVKAKGREMDEQIVGEVREAEPGNDDTNDVTDQGAGTRTRPPVSSVQPRSQGRNTAVRSSTRLKRFSTPAEWKPVIIPEEWRSRDEVQAEVDDHHNSHNNDEASSNGLPSPPETKPVIKPDVSSEDDSSNALPSIPPRSTLEAAIIPPYEDHASRRSLPDYLTYYLTLEAPKPTPDIPNPPTHRHRTHAPQAQDDPLHGTHPPFHAPLRSFGFGPEPEPSSSRPITHHPPHAAIPDARRDAASPASRPFDSRLMWLDFWSKAREAEAICQSQLRTEREDAEKKRMLRQERPEVAFTSQTIQLDETLKRMSKKFAEQDRALAKISSALANERAQRKALHERVLSLEQEIRQL